MRVYTNKCTHIQIHAHTYVHTQTSNKYTDTHAYTDTQTCQRVRELAFCHACTHSGPTIWDVQLDGAGW